GLDGFRRLRKASLIDAILGESGEAESAPAEAASEPAPDEEAELEPEERPASRARGGRSRTRAGARERPSRRAERPAGATAGGAGAEEASARTASGVVEVLGNGSAFLRVDPPEPSDEDVYISAAQVRRCELVSGDRVTGPVRTPRRSERYPSLVRVDTINGG